MQDLDFNEFKDDSWGIFSDAYYLVSSYGWHKGDALLQLFKGLVKNATGDEDITFQGLVALKEQQIRRHGFSNIKELHILGVNLSKQRSEIFSHETEHANVSIALALRISMSIPLFFAAVRLPSGLYVDGGLLRNYPLDIFDRVKYIASMQQPNSESRCFNHETLGLRVDQTTEIEKFASVEDEQDSINGFSEYATALLKTILEAQNERHERRLDIDGKRSIYCNVGKISAIDFSLSEDDKAFLIRSGEKAAHEHIKRPSLLYAYPQPSPVLVRSAHSALRRTYFYV